MVTNARPTTGSTALPAQVLLAAKAPADSKSADGRTPVHLAAEGGHAGIIKLLMEAGASPNSMTTRWAAPKYFSLKNKKNLSAFHPPALPSRSR